MRRRGRHCLAILAALALSAPALAETDQEVAAREVALELADETGAPVAAETFNSGTKAAAGFSVTDSGQYFVRVRLEEGEAAGVCFLYSYK